MTGLLLLTLSPPTRHARSSMAVAGKHCSSFLSQRREVRRSVFESRSTAAGGDFCIGRGWQRNLPKSPFCEPIQSLSSRARSCNGPVCRALEQRHNPLRLGFGDFRGGGCCVTCKDSQGCHGDMFSVFRRQFPGACDRSQFSTVPLSLFSSLSLFFPLSLLFLCLSLSSGVFTQAAELALRPLSLFFSFLFSSIFSPSFFTFLFSLLFSPSFFPSFFSSFFSSFLMKIYAHFYSLERVGTVQITIPEALRN